MVSGDAGRGGGVERIGAIPQTQPGAARVVRHRQLQDCALGRLLRCIPRVEHGLEGRSAQAQVAADLVQRDLGPAVLEVPPQLPLRTAHGCQERPPRGRLGRQPARHRVAATRGGVSGHDLPLPGQCGEHPGVGGEQHHVERRLQAFGEPAQRPHQIIGDGLLVLGQTRTRVRGPPGDRCQPTPGEQAPPEVAFLISQHVHVLLSWIIGSRPHPWLRLAVRERQPATRRRVPGAVGRSSDRSELRRDCLPTSRVRGSPRPS